MQTYCSEDLGAFYLDILKDRLYTSAASAAARRSAQTALWHIAQSLVRGMAPILSFTAEEAWPWLNTSADPNAAASIFTQVWPTLPELPDAPDLIAKWGRLRTLRGEVLRAIEVLRAQGQLGSSLQAEVSIAAHGILFEDLASLGDDLRFVLITSAAHLRETDDETSPTIDVRASTHTKCERCWHWREDVGHDPAHPSLCARCTSNLFGTGERRRFA